MRIALLKAALLLASGLGVLAWLVTTSRTSFVAVFAYAAIWAGIEAPIRLLLRRARLRRLKCPACFLAYQVDSPVDGLEIGSTLDADATATLLTCGNYEQTSAFDPSGRVVRPREWGFEEWPCVKRS